MYWLARPPFLRQFLAGLLLLAAVIWEFRPTPTESRPFLARDVVGGDPVEDGDIDWRQVPIGVLPLVDDPTGTYLLTLAAGTPLPAGATNDEPTIPSGWWGIEVPIPAGVVPGTDVRVVVDVRNDPKVIPGRVIRLLGNDSLEGTTALVAIPEEQVGAAAAAVADGSLRTLVGGS